ncbi:aminoacyl-tRNA hydrolase [Halarsenatibacter silvermanii]|uniref:Peptidyl-tRNA hydrolase n=1 Tax=Halarsenatibacter silvermanii TaxID=321763 RepID=A0A1G9QFE3_9FIRM|nr:aminoacyl-tRNA hydrolase [Halarsenatibacter silvermanii]SDM09025.1 peptidyl-tRNA hydrolase [Halarsenatibacter silvermanii]
MNLIVGLGNPVPKYENTRHNIGFQAVRKLAEKHNFKARKRDEAMVAEDRIKGYPAAIAQPLTLMNRSGRAVSWLVDEYSAKPRDLLVIHDDLDLEMGRIRLKYGGSSGGHNGIKSIIKALDTPEFNRLRLGIGRPPPGVRASDYVLDKFSSEEKLEVIEPALARAVEAVELWLEEDLDAAMNRFN